MPVPFIDRALRRIANASQLGLLALAVFGYFYTVVPVYEKTLLDEEIAKKTLELNSKEAQLRSKNEELAELNATVEMARNTLRRSQTEVGMLKGTVREQYAELRPRLIREFQLLGSKLCKLRSIPEGSFSACVREKVMTTVNLAPLTGSDRKLLQELVDSQNADIHTSWSEFQGAIETRKRDAEARKKQLTQKCDQLRASDGYKDFNDKISIDLECSSDLSRSHSEFIKIDIDSLYSGEDFLASRLGKIASEFFGKSSAP